MHCKACDAEMSDNEVYWREPVPGVKVMEDLCRKCRRKIFEYSDSEEFDLIGSLGYDLDND